MQKYRGSNKHKQKIQAQRCLFAKIKGKLRIREIRSSSDDSEQKAGQPRAFPLHAYI